MRLATRQWSEGPRTAVLIHGILSMGDSWHAVARELGDRGYAVTTVDLPGHGHSPRADAYPPSLVTDAVIAAVPEQPDLLIGHSLGALVARAIAPQLRPRRIVYADPAFGFVRRGMEERRERARHFRGVASITDQQIRADHPAWSEADLRIERLGFGLFDPAFADIALDDSYGELPEPAPVPALVIAAEYDSTVDDSERVRLASQGCEVRVVAGTGHCVNRDDHAGFMAALEDWL